MDRQALLEKKRQRLLELKQRRIDFKDTEILADSIASVDVPEPPKRVDFAVQVDLPINHESVASAPVSESPSVSFRFDKAVQTNFEEIEEIEDAGKASNGIHVEVPEPIEDISEPSTEEILHSTLQEQLAESNFNINFSDLRLGIKDKAVTVEAKAPFNSVPGLSHFLDRPITSVDTTAKFPDLLLVGYARLISAKKRSTIPHLASTPGLAIIYNRSTEPMLPEFFLQCTSGITTARFDKTDPFRVVAGLENGRVVMWDLTSVKPTQIAVLPTLQTTSLASIAEVSRHNYIHHTAPIVLIEQPAFENHSSSIITVSAEGVINVWSLNLLAFPKLDSVKILSSNNTGRVTMKDDIRISSVLVLRNSQRLSEDGNNSLHAPEYGFLNHTVLGSKNGLLYKLLNNKDKKFIKTTCTSREECFAPHIDSVTALAELPLNSTSSLVVSAHLDWHIRLWDITAASPILSIPTATLVTGIFIRPNHSFQMVTIGCVKAPEVGVSIDFWDLLERTVLPISSIPVQGSLSIAATFTDDGSQLVVAFGNGEICIWEIEETKLKSHIQTSTKQGIDEGIQSFLKGR